MAADVARRKDTDGQLALDFGGREGRPAPDDSGRTALMRPRHKSAKTLQIGGRYGRWEVIGPAVSKPISGTSRAVYHPCRCDCGTERIVRAKHLREGSSRSCGCALRKPKPEKSERESKNPGRDELESLYVEQGLTLSEIGVRLGVSRSAVWLWLKADGIRRRDAGPRRTAENPDPNRRKVPHGRRRIDGPAVVYFLRVGPTGPIKIGCSSQLAIRVQDHRRQLGRPVCILGVIRGGIAEERDIQQKFADLETENEWFRPDPYLLDFIAHAARPWDGTDARPRQARGPIVAEPRHPGVKHPAIGTVVGRLTVIGPPVSVRTGWRTRNIKCLCRCECGKERLVRASSLLGRKTLSCGCLAALAAASRAGESNPRRSHGESKTRLYAIWCGMIYRCHRIPSTKTETYRNYRGRGIRVCDEWRGDYEAFRDWATANGYRDGLDIDRRENDGDYEPSNCRWVTRLVNANNTRINRRLDIFGESKTVSEWARDARCAVAQSTFKHRLNTGWDADRALTTPARHIRTPRSGYKTGRGLKASDIPEVRRRIADGDKDAEIARDHGVSPGTIYAVRSGRTWVGF